MPTKTASGEIKSRITRRLDELSVPSSTLLQLRSIRGDNLNPALAEIYFWQEVEAHAKAKLKASWETAVREGMVPSDDKLRESEGESIVAESENFSVVTTVKKSSQRFDKDIFIGAVARKFRIDRAKLEKLAGITTKDSAPALTKRILEA
jgi:DNA repair exonuclease SbcCD nuclease subunit